MTLRALLASLLLVLGLAAGAEAAVNPPPLTGRVVDAAGVLPAEKVREIEAMLAAHEAKTTEQVVVATVPSLDGNDIETYANETFRIWKLGQKDKNNGVLFLIAPNEREMRIEVGYGLEGTLTDAISSQIIRNIVTPYFKAGNLPGGVAAGTEAILKVLGGEALPEAQAQNDWENAIPFIVFFLIWLFFVANARRRGRGGGMWWGGGGFGGGGFGGGGGGGGFSGGGGSSGGGGASGRW